MQYDLDDEAPEAVAKNARLTVRSWRRCSRLRRISATEYHSRTTFPRGNAAHRGAARLSGDTGFRGGRRTLKGTQMPSYQDMLNSERWKQKRQEILERDDYTCRSCQRKTATEVHHICYYTNSHPADYPGHLLRSFCTECHQREHEMQAYVNTRLGVALRSMGAANSEITQLTHAIAELSARHPDPAGWVTKILMDIEDDIARCENGYSPRVSHARH